MVVVTICALVAVLTITCVELAEENRRLRARRMTVVIDARELFERMPETETPLE